MTELRISREISTYVAADPRDRAAGGVTDLVPHVADDLRLQAAEIVQAVIPMDLPRLVVVEEHDTTRGGSCIGSGHRLATAHGYPGSVAVRVAAESFLVRWLTAAKGEPDGFELATRGALADVLWLTAHEVAHAIDYPADDPADADMARAWVKAAGKQDDATEIAASHRARWAAMFSIIAGRCQRHVSLSWGRYMGRQTAKNIVAYGHDHRLLRRAAGRVPSGVPLREYFASGSPACLRLRAVQTTDAARAVVIGSWLTPRAAG